MTRDEIINMAREAGARVFGGKLVIADNASSGDGSDFVPRFAALVAAAERDACALDQGCDRLGKIVKRISGELRPRLHARPIFAGHRTECKGMCRVLGNSANHTPAVAKRLVHNTSTLRRYGGDRPAYRP